MLFCMDNLKEKIDEILSEISTHLGSVDQDEVREASDKLVALFEELLYATR